MKPTKIAKLDTAEKFLQYLSAIGVRMPFETRRETKHSNPLNQPLSVHGKTVGNRFCVLPMEGWDGTRDGRPTELTRRRWRRFGLSGAKLIWGCEAVAVRHDGRANPNQLLINDRNLSELESLREELVRAHVDAFARVDDLSVGLQLTHSGRFARPNSFAVAEPRIVYPHPILDRRFRENEPLVLLSDEDLRRLIDAFASAARRAQKAGFDWVDIKHCHGYLGHELLSGFDRPGVFGGSFENRTRFLREITAAIRAEASPLRVAVRVSIFDFVPFECGFGNVGVPAQHQGYLHAWGGDGTGTGLDLSEPDRFMDLLSELGIELVCTTAGSPYYCPHIQRPAAFPPSDGYRPPEDPLASVARQIEATADIKARHPQLTVVGSGYSYLQEWLPFVAQAAVRDGMVDAVGLGRMILSYPEFPADVLSDKPLRRKQLCRTFSDCTTAPRNGLVSGCFPLDDFYKQLPQSEQLRKFKSNGS